MTGRILLDMLESNLRDVVALFNGLNPQDLDDPRTASQHPGGRPWSAIDHLAHLMQRELDFLPIAQGIAAHEPDPLRLGHRGTTPSEQSEFVNRENQKDVDLVRGASRSELLARLTNARTDLMAIINAMPDADLNGRVTVAPGRELAATDLLASPARHAQAHLEMLRAVES